MLRILKSKMVQDIREKIKSFSSLNQKHIQEIIKGAKVLNELVLTELYLSYINSNIFYCTDWKEFLVYNGKYYSYKDNDDIEDDIFHVAMAVYPEETVRKKNKNTMSSAFKNLRPFIGEEKRIV